MKETGVRFLVSFALVVVSLVGFSEGEPVCTDQLQGTGNGTWSGASWSNGTAPNTIDARVSLVPTTGSRESVVSLVLPNDSQPIGAILDATADTRLIGSTSQRADPVIYQVQTLCGLTNSRAALFYESPWNWHPRTGLNFTGTGDIPSYLWRVNSGFGLTLGVEAGTATVDEIANGGYFVKDGAGELCLTKPSGSDQFCLARAGTLTLSSGTSALCGDAEPAPGAAFHVDADRIDASQTVEIGGRMHVTAWTDVSGNGMSAAKATSGDAKFVNAQTPWIVERAGLGHKLLDFGPQRAFASEKAGYGPSCGLTWNKTLTNVREYFAVYEETDMLDGVDYCAIGRNDFLSFMNKAGTAVYESHAAGSRVIGDLRFNGQREFWIGGYGDCTRLHVVSEAMPDNQTMNSFGFERNISLGGIRAGEFIVYTNALTEAERAQTIAYLVKKWVTGKSATETSAWNLGGVKGSGAAVCVKAGETASVAAWTDLNAGATFRKTGAGTLAVGHVEPADATVSVEGGKVCFADGRSALSADPQPAASALYRFDATADNAFGYAGGEDAEGHKYLSTWAASEGGVTATAASTDTYTSGSIGTPVELTDVPFAGRKAVDFGAYGSNGSRMLFSTEQKVREMFVVLKMHDHSVYTALPTPFSFTEVSRGYHRQVNALLQIQFSAGYLGGAVWTVDGQMIDPFSSDFGDHFAQGSDGFHVYRLSAVEAVSVNAFARNYFYYGGYSTYGGGLIVGEAIGYDRTLTDAERRETEAYLLKKWKKAEHPSSVPFAGTMAFADGVPPEIASDADVTIGKVVAKGVLVKSGAGDLTVKKIDGITGYEVRGGSLGIQEDPLSDAYFHVDASDPDSFEYAVGTAQNEVSKWKDVRGNGRYAEALVTNIGNNDNLLKYPQVGSESVKGLSEGMPYVDFLHFARPADYGTIPCASMRWVDETGSMAGSSDIREVHIVYVDDIENYEAGTLSAPGSFIGSWNWITGQLGYTYQFTRGAITESTIFRYCTYTKTANMRMDGVELVGDNYISGGNNMHAHVLSIASTGYPMEANAFCNDRGNCGAGGYKICEVVVFTGETNTTARFAAINDYLCKKWRGLGAGAALASSGSLKATGGTLKLSSLTGAVAPADDANLAFAFRDADDYGRIEVSGDFAVPATGTISVTLPQRGEPKPAPGKYVLLQADRFLGAENFENWTISAETDGQFAADVQVDAENGRIVLTISRFGSALILR